MLLNTEVKTEGGSFAFEINIIAKFCLSAGELSQFTILILACDGAANLSIHCGSYSEIPRKHLDTCWLIVAMRSIVFVVESFATKDIIFLTTST